MAGAQKVKICKQCGATFIGGEYAQFCKTCRNKMAVVVKERTCIMCGRVFQGGPNAQYCAACKIIRRRDLDARRLAKGKPDRKLGSTDNCMICGKEYIVNAGNQKYCPDCAYEALRAADRPKSRQWNADHKETYYRAKNEKRRSNRFCVICGAPIIAKTATITCDNPACKLERARQQQRAGDAKRRGKSAPADYIPTKRSRPPKKSTE